LKWRSRMRIKSMSKFIKMFWTKRSYSLLREKRKLIEMMMIFRISKYKSYKFFKEILKMIWINKIKNNFNNLKTELKIKKCFLFIKQFSKNSKIHRLMKNSLIFLIKFFKVKIRELNIFGKKVDSLFKILSKIIHLTITFNQNKIKK
jgi:hypothetical protein